MIRHPVLHIRARRAHAPRGHNFDPLSTIQHLVATKVTPPKNVGNFSGSCGGKWGKTWENYHPTNICEENVAISLGTPKLNKIDPFR